jgi:rRNA pseudouridine-1189 N-methylase Emg1 (Nep1/Mra1 family)
MEEAGLKELLEKLAPHRTLLFTPTGERKTLAKVFPAKKNPEGTAVLIGAFSHGDFTPATAALASERLSVADEPMEAWAVAAEVLHRLADVSGLA